MAVNDNLQSWILATTVTVTVLAVVAVGLRLLSRYERKQKLWWDDWMILWSLAWNLAAVGFIFVMYHLGIGYHASSLPPNHLVLIGKYLLVAEIIYVFNLVWTKFSILLMYYRVFPIRRVKYCAYFISALVSAWVICITFLLIFICVPVQKLWYPQLKGHCINQVGTWISNSIATIITDLMILLLPMPLIWNLQLGRLEKIALTLTFGLGFFVVFTSAYRLRVLFVYNPYDSSYTLALTVTWTAVEMSIGIVSACLPTMRPALQCITRGLGISTFVPSIVTRLSGNTSKNSQTDNPSNTGESTGNNSGRAQPHSFYHLPSSNESMTECGGSIPMHEAVYMEKKGTGVSQVAEKSVWESDEVPLHGIYVQKEFSCVDSGYDHSPV